MTTQNAHRIDRQVVYGFLFLALVAALVAGTIAKYRGVFDDNVLVTVEADRAGLTLASGAPIKLRGVEIGRVGKVESDGEKVRIELKIDADKVDRVSADVTAQIVPPTAFGAKYVQLTPPADSTSGDGAMIRAGAVIPADRVTVEVDEAFENLTKVLDVARPAEVSSALTAVAGAVEQRGELIGALITQTDAYLRSFNPSLRTLSADLRVADDVADVYAIARPDLVDALSQAGEVSQTLVQQQASLRALERSLTGFSDSADVLLRDSEQGLVTSLRLLQPVSAVVERYSPELPCLLLGLASANKLAEAAVGGTHPGVTTYTRVVPGRDPYTYEENLPQIGADNGPACYGLPYVTPEEARVPPPSFRTGANPYVGPQPTPSEAVVDTLLGLLKGGTNLP
ncbi:MCE family protein [Pimelobacter simplex]|uniref:MCE-family protein MceA n=1 Tax=Nocardioides simplex TaxID=2045 RepID=A0A0C5XFR2_NOCSI|nr:MCE family protein [Pimelobacter simplex]AJR18001.1 MCE-family protein MceA [Pimelobacter simplex]MCG8150461.1 MCE family protein [Pimelobacter simplex]SFM88060.1 phospholipid/cholesterol/gamma-HCH transport system substrate-binding protein [Pimelobacter simplex]